MKRNLVIAAITAAALIGGGTYTAVAMGGGGTADPGTPSAPVSRPGSPDGSPSSDDSPRPRVSRAEPTAEPTAGATAGATAGQAADAALKEVPGTVVSVERDDDRGGRWEVDLLGEDNRRHELTVGGDGTVRSDDRHHDDDDDRADRAALRGATVDARQAADAALAAVPGSVTSIEIDGDRTGHWEVDVRGEDGRTHELNVHARTGEVTPDRDDDHGDDDHDGDDHGDRHGDDDGGRHGDDRGDDGQDG
ncbi:PepSY domain-containing protein [Streptomyces sp. NPDC055025]